jgi:hypothetical protein
MMFDFTGPTVALCGLLFTIASSIIGVWRRMENRVQETGEKASARAAAVEKELQDYKLHVAETYASWKTVEKIEERLTERIDSVSGQVSNLPDVVVERIMKFLALKP